MLVLLVLSVAVFFFVGFGGFKCGCAFFFLMLVLVVLSVAVPFFLGGGGGFKGIICAQRSEVFGIGFFQRKMGPAPGNQNVQGVIETPELVLP